MVKIVRLALIAASALAFVASTQARTLRALQYDNIPNAVITFANDPSSAPQGIADNVQSNVDGLNTAVTGLGTAIASGGMFGTQAPPADDAAAPADAPAADAPAPAPQN